MAYIRLDSELTTSDKFLDLSSRLKVGTKDTLWNLTHFWFWVSVKHHDGVLQNISDYVIAHQAQWFGDPKAFVNALVDSGFLDRGDGCLSVHEWEKWRPEWVRSKSRRISEKRPENDQKTTSSVQYISSSSSVMSFSVSGKTKTWELREDMLLNLKDLYPGIDVILECKKANAWIENNPLRRKTASGMPRFLNSWMERAQNRRGGFIPPTTTNKESEILEALNQSKQRRLLADAAINTARESSDSR